MRRKSVAEVIVETLEKAGVMHRWAVPDFAVRVAQR